MPSFPDTRPWWRVNANALYRLVRNVPAYSRWVAEMNEVRLHGSAGWWQARLGKQYGAFQQYVDAGKATAVASEPGDDA
jgi:hypothetical protein